MRWLPQPIRLFLWTTKLPAQLLRPEQRKIPPAQRDIGLWTERVPTEVNPADLPSRDRGRSFETEPVEELASLSDILPAYDFSWVALQRAKWPFRELEKTLLFPCQKRAMTDLCSIAHEEPRAGAPRCLCIRVSLENARIQDKELCRLASSPDRAEHTQAIAILEPEAAAAPPKELIPTCWGRQNASYGG